MMKTLFLKTVRCLIATLAASVLACGMAYADDASDTAGYLQNTIEQRRSADAETGMRLPDVPFNASPESQAVFSFEEEFIPIGQLPFVEYDEDEERDPARMAHDLTAVSITPNGEVSIAEVTEQDLELLANVSDMFPRDVVAEQASTDEQTASDSYKGVIFPEAPAVDPDASYMTEDFLSDNEADVNPRDNGAETETGGWSRLESVLGMDERIRVDRTTDFPYRTIGHLSNGCTGTLVGSRHVLTAAHCVYNTADDTWYGDLSFTPGLNESAAPFGTISWSRMIAPQGWTESHSENYDYAMIILSSPVGQTTGWLGYGYRNGNWTMDVNVNGYPGDKPEGTMWHADCPLSTMTQNSYHVSHVCDTNGGMSGSGLYTYDSTTNSRIIRAVHTMGGGSVNFGTRITSEVFSILRNWQQQYP